MIAAPDLAAIPSWMTNHPRWVAWREVSRKGKKTKVPLTALNTPAESNNPTTWSLFEPIADAVQRQPSVFDGVGFNLGTLADGGTPAASTLTPASTKTATFSRGHNRSSLWPPLSPTPRPPRRRRS